MPQEQHPRLRRCVPTQTLHRPSTFSPIKHLLLRDRHPDVPRPVGIQASDLASLRVACARAECETTALSAKADAAHSAAAAAEAARHALALEAGEVRRREAELLRENARLAGEKAFRGGVGAGVSPGDPNCGCIELESNVHLVAPMTLTYRVRRGCRTRGCTGERAPPAAG